MIGECEWSLRYYKRRVRNKNIINIIWAARSINESESEMRRGAQPNSTFYYTKLSKTHGFTRPHHLPLYSNSLTSPFTLFLSFFCPFPHSPTSRVPLFPKTHHSWAPFLSLSFSSWCAPLFTSLIDASLIFIYLLQLTINLDFLLKEGGVFLWAHVPRFLFPQPRPLPVAHGQPVKAHSYAYSLYTCVFVLGANASRSSICWWHVKGYWHKFIGIQVYNHGNWWSHTMPV